MFLGLLIRRYDGIQMILPALCDGERQRDDVQ